MIDLNNNIMTESMEWNAMDICRCISSFYSRLISIIRQNSSRTKYKTYLVLASLNQNEVAT